MVVAKLYESFNVRYDEDAFCFFDRNSDESINVDEFHEAMGRLQFTGEGTIGLMRGEVAELIDRIDSDSSGEISFAEFRAALDVNSMSEAYEAIKQVRMGTHALPHARTHALPSSLTPFLARPPARPHRARASRRATGPFPKRRFPRCSRTSAPRSRRRRAQSRPPARGRARRRPPPPPTRRAATPAARR